MKIEGYEEISFEEFDKLPNSEKAIFNNLDEYQHRYFKKAQKFPIVFESEGNKIEVEDYTIRIIDLGDKESVAFEYDDDFPLLVKAVEKAKEIMEKKS